MNWYVLSVRIVLLVAAATALGWYYGKPMLGALLALVGLVCFWVVQLRRVQNWLDDPEQPPPDIYGIWGDILARIYKHRRREKDARARLQSTADFFRSSFASMGDGVVIVNERGNIIWANGAVQALTGVSYPADEGQPLQNLVRSPEFNNYLLSGDYREPLEFCINSETGLYLVVEITPFGEGDRLLFFRDVSAMVQIEQIRRDFIANVSHELRTPLTVLTGYLGTMLSDRDNLPAPYQRPMQQMVQQSERMENLLKDLLWLSRIESQERQEKLEVIKVPMLLEEIRQEMASSCPDRQISLELDSQRSVTGDYRELHSAVSNLVLNADKYSALGSPVVVSWREVAGGTRLRVSDSGIGIDPIHFPRLTERFYRVDDSRSSATGGTGLGLAIVKHVAVSHGAELNIESRPGEGSSFSLLFPDADKDHDLIRDEPEAVARANERVSHVETG